MTGSGIQFRDIAGLTDQANKLTKSLVERYENIIALLAMDETSYSATAVSEYQLQLEVSLLTSNVEEILRTIRQMQELWLFGKLDTINNRPPVSVIAKEEKDIIQRLISRIEKPTFFPPLSASQVGQLASGECKPETNIGALGTEAYDGFATQSPSTPTPSSLQSRLAAPTDKQQSSSLETGLPDTQPTVTATSTVAPTTSRRSQRDLDEEQFQSNVREMEILGLGDIADAFEFHSHPEIGLEDLALPPGFERFGTFGRGFGPEVDELAELEYEESDMKDLGQGFSLESGVTGEGEEGDGTIATPTTTHM